MYVTHTTHTTTIRHHMECALGCIASRSRLRCSLPALLRASSCDHVMLCNGLGWNGSRRFGLALVIWDCAACYFCAGSAALLSSWLCVVACCALGWCHAARRFRSSVLCCSDAVSRCFGLRSYSDQTKSGNVHSATSLHLTRRHFA